MATILLVDDIEDNRKLLEFDLEDDGHKVLEADSGPAALELLKTEKPDMILLDVNMPGMSGLELLDILKKDKKYQSIPVIMVTANDMDEEITAALDKGANDYVIKSSSHLVLAARMRTSLRLKKSQDDLRRANKYLEILATTDGLTALYNRRHFFELSKKELSKARRYSRPLVIAMIDIDHFKKINDENGHDGGDKVLIEMAKRMRSCFRESDIVGRIGGEEFAVCMPDTDIDSAMLPLERVLKAVSGEVFSLSRVHRERVVNVTISIGFSQLIEEDTELTKAVRRADAAMYQAKNNGRNRIVEYSG